MFNTIEKELDKKVKRYKEELISLRDLELVRKDIDSSKSVSNIRLAEELGFTNSKILKQSRDLIDKNKSFNDAIQAAVKSLGFMKELSDYFGEGTILIKLKDFIHLIQKYDLICGSFSDYLGVIPDENLKEISESKRKIENIPNTNYSYLRSLYNTAKNTYKIINISTYRTDELTRNTKDLLNRFPIMFNDNNFSSSYSYISLRGYLSNYLHLPENEVGKISDCSIFSINYMFIAAPRKEMKNAKKGISFRIQQPDDPFICSLTPEGVVIYSRWGKEAADETLKKYDKLFSKL